MEPSFRIEIRKQPQKFIQKQSPDQQKRIVQAIYALPQGDTKP